MNSILPLVLEMEEDAESIGCSNSYSHSRIRYGENVGILANNPVGEPTGKTSHDGTG